MAAFVFALYLNIVLIGNGAVRAGWDAGVITPPTRTPRQEQVQPRETPTPGTPAPQRPSTAITRR